MGSWVADYNNFHDSHGDGIVFEAKRLQGNDIEVSLQTLESCVDGCSKIWCENNTVSSVFNTVLGLPAWISKDRESLLVEIKPLCHYLGERATEVFLEWVSVKNEDEWMKDAS